MKMFWTQVIMRQKKEYDMLESQMSDNIASYLKCSSNDIIKVKVMFVNDTFCKMYYTTLSYLQL